ncbi:methyl-accepting chemotaxis protein [Aeromonas diversa]|uniref:methyl-accepting chemotaxis protein n=1 Tax=Aeromonas diversa TaxID=502790 RepID=UPI003461C0A3
MLRTLSIRQRLLLVSLLIVLSLVLLTLLAATLDYRSLMAEKGKQTRHQVETAWSLVASYAKRVEAGELDEAQAKQAALQTLKALRYGHDDYFWINDSRPFMVMHPMKPALDGQDLSTIKDPSGKRLFVEFVTATQTQREGGHVAYQWPKPGADEPVAKISFVKRFEPWDWIIGTGIYVDDVQQQYWQVLVRLLALSGVILAVLCGALWWLTRSIVTPLAATTGALDELARGEGDLRARLQAEGRDELSALARNFNRFTEQMGSLVQQVQGIAAENDKAATQLASVARSHHRLANEQVGDTKKAAEAIALVTTGCTQIGDHTREAAASAEQAMMMIREGQSLMQETADAVGRLAAQLMTSVTAVSQLDSNSQSIEKVLEVIRGVAEQTNLLALNAAIEAARAGEQGRGFAVVADEVRTLANRTHASTDEIRDMIARVQEGTAQVTGQIGQLQSLSDVTASSAARMGEVIGHISTVIDTISRMNGHIAEAANQQTDSVLGIHSHMDTIAQAAHRALEHNEQTERAVVQLESRSRQLSTLVGSYRI